MRNLSARERRTILDRAEAVLGMNPVRESRDLKVLRANPLARWELRIGDFRIFFDVEQESRQVMVLAVGRKQGNRIWIAGREVRL